METRQPALWAAGIVTYAAALVAFVLRLVAKRMKGIPFHWGDALAWISFIFTTAYTALTLYKMKPGLGLHLEDIGLRNDEKSYYIAADEFFRLLWLDMWLYTAAIGFSKLTALALYWRIFGQSTIKLPIKILLGTVLAWMLARVIVISLLCVPIRKLWHLEMTTGHCGVSANDFFFGSTVPHLLMEIAIVLLPCLKVRSLKLPRMQKIAVAAMFASGTLVCVASFVQLIQAIKFNPHSFDIWWTATPQTISVVIEVNIGHFSTSLPNLRPIVDVIVGRKSTIEGRGTSYGRFTDDEYRPTRQSNLILPRRQETQIVSKTESEVELAQVDATEMDTRKGAGPGQIWKFTTMEVESRAH